MPAGISRHWATRGSSDAQWIDRDADGYSLTDSVKLIRTPGHSPEDMTVLAGTNGGIVAFVGDFLVARPARPRPGWRRGAAVGQSPDGPDRG
jgi:glyoxylase-like metal-dependent hydrolase (beta-lactamase superfamily II)